MGFMLTLFHRSTLLDVSHRLVFITVLQLWQVWISCKSFQIPGSILANNASMSQNDFSSSLVMMMRYPAMKFIPWNTQTADCIRVSSRSLVRAGLAHATVKKLDEGGSQTLEHRPHLAVAHSLIVVTVGDEHVEQGTLQTGFRLEEDVVRKGPMKV